MEILKQIDELQQKINDLRPLGPEELKQIKEYYRIGLTYTSNALEGNTLTESETKIVLEEGLTISGKPMVYHLEALGHSDAYDFMYTKIKQKGFSEDDIKQLHKLFFERIDPKKAGIYRKIRAVITGSHYPLPSPEQLPTLMSNFVTHQDELRKDKHPVEFAALVHKEFVFIHPFIDGNGRVARLLMNLVLMQEGYNIALIPPLTRSDYIRCLEQAHTNDRPFIEFIARMVKETQQDYLRMLS